MYAPPSLSPTLVHPPILTSRANAKLSPELSPRNISFENTDGGPVWGVDPGRVRCVLESSK